MNLKTSEFFINMKNLPPESSEEDSAFMQLVNWEIEKCIGGVNVNGVHISGWLYWHLNHWTIYKDKKDAFNNIVRVAAKPDLRDNEWIIADYLEQCRVQQKGYMHIGSRQFGKDLLNSSILYLENSQTTIGECNIGDYIYGDDGQLTQITGKYPQGIKPVYQITLVDGRVLNCGLEHNWYVYDRLKDKYLVQTTKELLENYKFYRKSWEHRKFPYELRYSIPSNQPVQYGEKELEIDPYILGLWLGDGSNYYSKITNIDQEIVDYLYNYASSVGLQITKDGDDTYMITKGSGDKKLDVKNILHSFLTKKDLYQNKHIPKEYKYSSVEQRMELLRGLMDSDGSCSKNGTLEFSTTVFALGEDFYTLCRSLGINLSKKIKKCSYKKNGKHIECKDSLRFVLYTNKPIFKLTRKLAQIRRKPKYLDKVAINDIKYLRDDYTTCITVSNESHLFLTDNYTVTHNSESLASFNAYNATLFEGTQNVIVGGNDSDLSLIKTKIGFGIKNLWKGIQIPTLDKDWRKPMVRLGFKTKDNEDQEWSYIVIRNVADGKNTEGPAGVSAKSFAMDEVGKFPFAQTFEAAKPAFVSEFGWRAIPVLMGTGGAFEKGADAERFFYHPDANNFLGVTDPETGERTCIFLSGIYRQDCKYPTTLGKYLIEQGKVKEGTDVRELDKLAIRVADKQKALDVIKKERSQKASDPDQTEYLKAIMYYPLTPKECFMSSSDNYFNSELARNQKDRLESQYPGLRVGMFIELVEDENQKITHKPSLKLPISSYPMKSTEDANCPIVILEHPIVDPPYGLYVAGIDPYRFEKAVNSDSLGAIYIYKRSYDSLSDSFQDIIVAWYVARPDSKETWNNNTRLLIKYYNAVALCENDEMSFIDYMIFKGDAHYLMDSPEWMKEYTPGTSTSRAKGVSSNPKSIELFNTNLKQYMEEPCGSVPIQGSEETRKILGVHKINDPMLLQEIISWNKDGNFDRIRAASIAITCAKKLDSLKVQVSVNEDYYSISPSKRKRQSGVFKPINPLSHRSNLSRLFK